MDAAACKEGREVKQRIIVTGGAGYIVSVLVATLLERGAEVLVTDSDRYDLRCLEDIRRALSGAKPHMVIHLAARVGGIRTIQAH
jgi:GDP-L-fucose synthase